MFSGCLICKLMPFLSKPDGLESVLDCCKKLRHLNLLGIHYHAVSSPNRLLVALSKLQSLVSLALPACGVISAREPATQTGDNANSRIGEFFENRSRISHESTAHCRRNDRNSVPLTGPEQLSTSSDLLQVSYTECLCRFARFDRILLVFIRWWGQLGVCHINFWLIKSSSDLSADNDQ